MTEKQNILCPSFACVLSDKINEVHKLRNFCHCGFCLILSQPYCHPYNNRSHHHISDNLYLMGYSDNRGLLMLKKENPEGLQKKLQKLDSMWISCVKWNILACTDIHRSTLIIHYQWYFKISILIHFFTGSKAGFSTLHLWQCYISIYAGIWVRVPLQGSSALS